MAKNWTMAEAIKAIANQNAEDVKDIYRRYPTAAMLMTMAVAGDCEAACNIIASLPEWATINKFEKALKADVPEAEEMAEVEDDTEVEDEVVEEKPAPKAKKSEKAKTVKAEAAGDSDYANMSGKELWALMSKAKKLKDLKAKGYGTKKADLVAYLEKYGLGDSEPVVEAEAEDDTEVENEADESKYALLSAQDLFKECKRRKLEVKPKKPVKYYIDLLEKNDAEQANGTDAEDDNWDDEPEVAEEKPKVKAKKSEKPAKKPAKVEEADDDEDWDI